MSEGRVGNAPQNTGSNQRRRQNEILDAAAKVFAERGYYGASTQDIANVLGIRQASLYYYFSSKEIALELVCMKGVEGFFEAASEVAAKKISASEKVRGLVEAHLTPLLDRADFVKTFLNERQYLPPASRKKVGKLSRAYERVIEKVIAEGIANGEFRKGLDPRLMTLALLGMCKSVASWLGKEDAYAVPKVSQEYARILLGGIANSGR
ncbi:MAG: TetR/AcrR family transcriptional regulator [Xanthobacteraceae bacterium]|nr:TetR/AcrR family transcriptional regulator [Xanthobacteraceae bacterium]